MSEIIRVEVDLDGSFTTDNISNAMTMMEFPVRISVSRKGDNKVELSLDWSPTKDVETREKAKNIVEHWGERLARALQKHFLSDGK